MLLLLNEHGDPSLLFQKLSCYNINNQSVKFDKNLSVGSNELKMMIFAQYLEMSQKRSIGHYGSPNFANSGDFTEKRLKTTIFASYLESP